MAVWEKKNILTWLEQRILTERSQCEKNSWTTIVQLQMEFTDLAIFMTSDRMVKFTEVYE